MDVRHFLPATKLGGLFAVDSSIGCILGIASTSCCDCFASTLAVVSWAVSALDSLTPGSILDGGPPPHDPQRPSGPSPARIRSTGGPPAEVLSSRGADMVAELFKKVASVDSQLGARIRIHVLNDRLWGGVALQEILHDADEESARAASRVPTTLLGSGSNMSTISRMTWRGVPNCH